MAQSGSELSGLSSIDEEGDMSGDEPSLRPDPVPAAQQQQRTPTPQPKTQSPERSESIEFSYSGDVSGSRPQSRDGKGEEPAQQDKSPATTRFSSFAGLESSDLGDQTAAHSPNLGSSAESSKQALPQTKEGVPPQTSDRPPASTRPSTGQTSAQFSGRDSNPANSSQEVSFGESGLSTPRRSQSPTGAAADAANGKHQAEGYPLEQTRSNRGDDVGQRPRSSGGSQQSGQKEQQRTQSMQGRDTERAQRMQRQGSTAQPQNQGEQSQEQQEQQQQQQKQHKKGVAINLMDTSESTQLAPAPQLETSESPKAKSLQARQRRQQEAMAEAEKAIQQGGLSSTCQETGVDIPSPLQLFMMYDKDGTCAMEMPEFAQMLYDLDGMAEVPPSIRDQYICSEFDLADLNHDGVISVDEFYFYYYRELCFKFPILRTGVNPGADLFNIFVKYATFGRAERSEEMTSNQFSKLCKDCKLINNKTVLKADIDIIFSRCRAETEVLEAFRPKTGSEYTTARMMYPQFLFGLLKVAEKRRSGFQEVVARIIENVSAVPRASMADLLVFQNTGDPKQAEEWVARPRGLPQLPRIANDAAERMQREAALAKNLKLPSGSKSLNQSTQSSTALLKSKQSGPAPAQAQDAGKDDDQFEKLQISEALASTKQRKQWGLQGFGSAESLGLPCVGRAALNDPRALIAVRKLNPDQLMMGLKRVFERYNLWQHGTNKGAMDKVRFNKMMRDAKFVRECGALSSSTADRIFQRSLPAVEVTLNFMQFLTALKHVAAALRVSLNEVMESILLINAPLATD